MSLVTRSGRSWIKILPCRKILHRDAPIDRNSFRLPDCVPVGQTQTETGRDTDRQTETGIHMIDTD